MKIEHILPADIERRSMEIIEEELGEICLPPMEKDVIKRVIHTSADFDYARTLRFSDAAVERGLAALRQGCTIVTDTNMACTGISQAALDKLGCRKVCFMADADVAAEAKAKGTTRAAACMDKACRLEGPVIIAVGNAPTALIRLHELMEQGDIRPELVIAVPVASSTSSMPRSLLWPAGRLISPLKAQGRQQRRRGDLQCPVVQDDAERLTSSIYVFVKPVFPRDDDRGKDRLVCSCADGITLLYYI